MTIVKKTLSEQIYRQLKKEILTHEIKFGEILVNRNLQERFQVSSSPIRDAILRLNEDGLIEKVTRSGAKVVTLTMDLAIQTNELLLITTLGAMELAIKKADPHQLASDLNQFITLQRQHISDDLYYDYDYQFHKTFFAYSQNNLLRKIFDNVNSLQSLIIRYYHESDYSFRNNALAEHQMMVDAIVESDYNQALQVNKAHFSKANDVFKKIIMP